MDAQIKKGTLELCILLLLRNGDLYGYDIMKQMNVYFPEVNESTFYAILRRLAKDGILETYNGEVSNGPIRKYYRITQLGYEELNHNLNDFMKLVDIINTLNQ
ncbi:MAG: PadR family transcriptional regulator [Erysipelotrichales bacterium]|nr:PadR family transcriptional regulator [Erysipelotrichales bacterium]